MSGMRIKSQSGMASFLIVMIMMLVITLIVLGVAQVTRRNSREALDRQLSAQAFYAAESGVNVTASNIQNYINTNGVGAMPTKASCDGDYDPLQPTGIGGAITPLATGVQYSCILVDPNPKSLQFQLTQTGSVVTPLIATKNFTSMTFSWKPGGNDTSCTGADEYTFPTAASWSCSYGVLRLDLVQDPDTNLGALAGNTVSVYLTPLGSKTINLPSFNTAARAYVGSASCNASTCQSTINFTPNSKNYYMRATTLYHDAPSVTVTGTVVGGTDATFSGSQAVLDATGRAQDQLRRVQVRMQLAATQNPDSIPAYAIGSGGDVCKHFTIGTGTNVNPAALCN
ncbi:MAG TPA: pilus assembly PilX N-terminal domain-containing protein [Candidatus Saccharimonadales bacterium]|nr:pilus assembly PilX N-terminal domain-containing protein [Candidatus Saccharimonadales bacterium]